MKQCILLILFQFVAYIAHSQEVINQIIIPSSESNGKKISELIEEIETLNDISISYSPSQFIDSKISQVPADASDLLDFLSKLLPEYKLTLKKTKENKYVLVVKEYVIYISGNVYDKSDYDLVAAAIIIDKTNGEAVLANDEGYFFLPTKPGAINIEVSMLGFEKYEIVLNLTNSGKVNFYLNPDNQLPEILKQSTQLFDPLTELIPRAGHNGKRSVFGENDPVNELKILPGITSGIEGQTGMIIRGGSPDQNLMMIDGMPIYESSHIANLSSIFINEAIRSIDFMKSGMPARYGGRLSSIINVQLKEGNKSKNENSLILGPQGGTFITEGPIKKEKISYTLGLRNSWINTFIKPFKSKISLYDDINIQYRDVIAKITYKINDDQKLTASFYSGRDRLSLLKENNVFEDFTVAEKNQFEGKNTLLSLNYDHILSSKFKINAQAGFIDYSVLSRGTYDYIINKEDTIVSHLDILNSSKILDKQVTFNADYYIRDNMKIRAGMAYIRHDYNPAVKQSILEIDNNFIENINDPDSAYFANELNSYVEFKIELLKRINLISGIYNASYSLEQYNKNAFQPRLQLLWDIGKQFSAHLIYSKTNQFVHLLASNGLGLPNELWVPSTSNIPAEELHHTNITLKYKPTKYSNIQLSVYQKRFKNLIEYNEPVDLFFNIIGDNDNKPILNSQRDWNRKIDIGTGVSSGIEFSFNIYKEKYQTWVSYHYGRAFRQFNGQNNGERFASRYDHPHNINLGFNYTISKKWSVGSQWIYTSGHPFTSADIIISTPFEIEIIQPSGKNNYRNPAFHTLNISAEYSFKINTIQSKFNFGVYNAYNRLNPFYIYSIKNTNGGVDFKKVSLYPILPQLNFKVSW